jgi:hypothetical protein
VTTTPNQPSPPSSSRTSNSTQTPCRSTQSDETESIATWPSPSTPPTTNNAASAALTFKSPPHLQPSHHTKTRPPTHESRRTTVNARPFLRSSSSGTMQMPSSAISPSLQFQSSSSPRSAIPSPVLETYLVCPFSPISVMSTDVSQRKNWNRTSNACGFNDTHPPPSNTFFQNLRWGCLHDRRPGRTHQAHRPTMGLRDNFYHGSLRNLVPGVASHRHPNKNMGSVKITFQGLQQRHLLTSHQWNSRLPRNPICRSKLRHHTRSRTIRPPRS